MPCQSPHRRVSAIALAAAAIALLASTAAAQWQIEDAHTTADLRGIANVGAGVAWASGSNGTVLRTEDGGYVWQLCAIPPGAEHLDFRGIQAFDNNTAIVMSSGKGDLSRLYKTTDGCQTWKLLFTNPDKDGFWDAVQFENRQRGVLLGDPVNGKFVLMETLDGGQHWIAVENKNLAPPTPQTGAFAASNSALTKRVDTPSFITGGPGGAYYYSGDNVCTSLIAMQTPETCIRAEIKFDRTKLPMNGDTASSGGFSLESSSTGMSGPVLVAVGGDFSNPAERRGTAAYFNNHFGGWFPAHTLPNGYRSAVAYDAKADVWITVGPNGTDISTDDGRNWRALTPGPEDQPDADKNWNAFSLPYAVGPKGRIGKLDPIHLDAAQKK